MAKVSQKELREYRKQMFSEMEDRLKNTYPKEEDRLFYYHSSEDRIVLSHAIFWVMTKSLVCALHFLMIWIIPNKLLFRIK